jgi:hypothetical protein
MCLLSGRQQVVIILKNKQIHMAEQEVIKHTKKIYKIWGNKEHGFWHKVKEFALEVFIIVFAVSLSIWLHSWSEHNHEQTEVKLFLLGLRSDLTRDVAEMQGDKKSFINQKIVFSYIAGLKLGQPMSVDTFVKYQKFVFNITGLNPNNGRFEGFKSSGKIATLENKELQNDIMDLYQEDIVALLDNTTSYNSIKRKIFDYVFANAKQGFADSSSDVPTVLVQTQPHNLAFVLGSNDEITAWYDKCINKANKIIAAINKEYGLSIAE